MNRFRRVRGGNKARDYVRRLPRQARAGPRQRLPQAEEKGSLERESPHKNTPTLHTGSILSDSSASSGKGVGTQIPILVVRGRGRRGCGRADLGGQVLWRRTL